MNMTIDQINALIAELNQTIVHQASSLRLKDAQIGQHQAAAGEIQRIAEGIQKERDDMKAKIEKVAALPELPAAVREALGLPPAAPVAPAVDAPKVTSLPQFEEVPA